MSLITEMEGFLFCEKDLEEGKKLPGYRDQSLEFKNNSKLYRSTTNAIQFLELCLSKFNVGIQSLKCGTEGKNLFVKFLSQKKRTIEKRIGFFLRFVDDCTKDNDGKQYKNMNILWENFKIIFSKNNTSMVVIEGDKVQGYPSKSCIMLKPYNIYSSMEDNLMIPKLWQDLSKIYGSTGIITFITSLNIQEHL